MSQDAKSGTWYSLSNTQRNALIAEFVVGWIWVDCDYDAVLPVNRRQRCLLPGKDATRALLPGDYWHLEHDARGEPIGNRLVPTWMPNYVGSIDVLQPSLERFSIVAIKMTLRGEGKHLYECTLCPVLKLDTSFYGVSTFSVADAACQALLSCSGVLDEELRVLRGWSEAEESRTEQEKRTYTIAEPNPCSLQAALALGVCNKVKTILPDSSLIIIEAHWTPVQYHWSRVHVRDGGADVDGTGFGGDYGALRRDLDENWSLAPEMLIWLPLEQGYPAYPAAEGGIEQ